MLLSNICATPRFPATPGIDTSGDLAGSKPGPVPVPRSGAACTKANTGPPFCDRQWRPAKLGYNFRLDQHRNAIRNDRSIDHDCLDYRRNRWLRRRNGT
ncbi:hypothetical protein V8G57_23695 [Collimonas sp. H4R21]|uniref:Uncharacterized protein n=1 Tax=Collimonas rhizosphaerae TaxID=3126357 RepID=A0ABU9Q2B6_9BURK